MPTGRGLNHVATITAGSDASVYWAGFDGATTLGSVRDRLADADANIGDVQQLGNIWSLCCRDPDGTELEVCAPITDNAGGER